MPEPLFSRLFFPFTEGAFTFDRYRAFAERLAAAPGLDVVPLRELTHPGPANRGRVGLRHDVDGSLERALVLARIEREAGLRATYFVLHTAPYWRSPRLVDALLELQRLGHEVGWHNDLVTLQCVLGGDARAFLGDELARLRSAGVDVVGTAAHGSPWCHAFGYHNHYFFSDLPPVAGFPAYESVPTPSGERRIEKGTLAEFGFSYEAYFLGEQQYVSDSSFENSRRWHPDAFDPATVAPGETAIVLVHPCHWDTGRGQKLGRAARRVVGRLVQEVSRSPRP